MDGDDTVVRFIYDERWRVVATYHDSDTVPTSEFIHHNAGLDGHGGGSYIDSVILRDRDASGDPSVMEERVYFCQDWRHDVVAIVSDTGKMLEWVDYTPYGMPYGRPAGDTDSDYDWDATDSAAITGGYDVRKDANLDGVIDANDVTHANSITGGYQTLGRGVLSSTGTRNTLGYAGYVADANLTGKWHVRRRVFDSELGRWLRRDPWGYVDGVNLYEFISCQPVSFIDETGAKSKLIIPAPGRSPKHWPSNPPNPPLPTEIHRDCHQRFMNMYQGCLKRFTPGDIRFSDCVRWAIRDLAFCNGDKGFYLSRACYGRLYDPNAECCELGQVVVKEPMWICERPLAASSTFGIFAGCFAGYLLNWVLPKGSEIQHTYICCDGANLNCFGKQSTNKQGQPVPLETLATGECKRFAVCPSVKNRKCNDPVCRKDYSLLGPGHSNCQDWAWELVN